MPAKYCYILALVPGEKILAGTYHGADRDGRKLQVDRSCRRAIAGAGFVDLHLRGRVSGENVGQGPLILTRVRPIDLLAVVENGRHLGKRIDGDGRCRVGRARGMSRALDGTGCRLDGCRCDRLDLAGGVACASEETDKTVPVIRSENPRRMSFLPVWSFETKNCSLHV